MVDIRSAALLLHLFRAREKDIHITWRCVDADNLACRVIQRIWSLQHIAKVECWMRSKMTSSWKPHFGRAFINLPDTRCAVFSLKEYHFQALWYLRSSTRPTAFRSGLDNGGIFKSKRYDGRGCRIFKCPVGRGTLCCVQFELPLLSMTASSTF